MRIPAEPVVRQNPALQRPAAADRIDAARGKADAGKSSGPSALKPAGSLLPIDGPTATAAATAPSELTLEGLFEAWGTNDPRYDLNGDQTVDVNDLVRFVEGYPQDPADLTKADPAASDLGATPSAGEIATPESLLSQAPTGDVGVTGDALPAASDMTLDGLYAAWGQANSMYDLNGDRTVDVNDLVAFMEQQSDAAPVSEHEPIIAPVQDPGTTTPVEPPADTPPPTLAGLMAAWGTSDETYDLNGDRTVDVNDLVAFMESYGTPHAEAATMGPDGGVAGKLARLMGGAFSAAGFQDQLPGNFGELLDQLNVDDADRKSVVKSLASKFPGGLGVNAVG